jgi:hypothetical protein
VSAGHGREVAVEPQAGPVGGHRGHGPGRAGRLGLDAGLVAPGPLGVGGQGGHDAVELAAGPQRGGLAQAGDDVVAHPAAVSHGLDQAQVLKIRLPPTHPRRLHVHASDCKGCDDHKRGCVAPTPYGASAAGSGQKPRSQRCGPVERPETGLQVQSRVRRPVRCILSRQCVSVPAPNATREPSTVESAITISSVNRGSFEYAVQHVAHYGDTDVFPFHPENRLFYDRPEAAVDILEEAHAGFSTWINSDATSGVSAMAPVGYTGFRWATQLDPLWNVYFLGLMVELAPAIEAARVSSEFVHSHRVQIDASSYSLFKRDGYLDFESASRDTVETYDWVVTTDIADFYPRVYHHRLENALREVDRSSDVPWRVMELLKRWSSNTSYGLPIGGPAARLLSELVLTRTDKLLLIQGHRFHRYADDYRLFANTKQEAHRSLTQLSELLLRNEGLALSKAKTRIMSRSEFISTIDLEGDDAEAAAELTENQRDRRRRARELLGLSLRYDPYAATAIEDYQALEEAVERLDIVDLFMMELSKPRIDPRLTRKLLRALEASDKTSQAHICTSLVKNMELLAPLIPQVLQAVRKVLLGVDQTIAAEARNHLSGLLAGRSYLFQLGVNEAFAVRVLADDPTGGYQQQLAQLFDTTSLPILQRDIVVAMARWGATYWLSDKKSLYDTYHPWVKRALLMSSYVLGDEGKHWRDALRQRLTPFDRLTRDWVAAQVQQPGWVLPL